MLFFKTLALGSMLAMNVSAFHPLISKRQNIAPSPVSGATFVHDPTMVKTPAGGYIAAFTSGGIGLKTSTDRKNWRDIGAAFPNGAPWTTKYTKGDRNLWAPDISYHNGQYYMYYSASSFGASASAIFLATSKTGLSNTWTNQGLIVESTSSSNYNAIDPNLIIDASGKWWLSFGSFWSGLKLIEINSADGKRSGNAMTNIAARPQNGGAIEAPFIHLNNGYYYLWASFDSCCKGAASTYRIMVGRSKNIKGPYLDKAGKDMMQGGGTQMMGSHGSIHGPGHNAVFTDTDGDVLVYHYYKDDGGAALGINRLKYVDGWPVIF